MDEYLNLIDFREFFSELENVWITYLNVFESGTLGRVEMLVAASRQRSGGLAYLIDELFLGCFAENYESYRFPLSINILYISAYLHVLSWGCSLTIACCMARSRRRRKRENRAMCKMLEG